MTLEDGLQRGLLDETPPLDRPYLELGTFLARAGEIERTQAMLEQWSADVPPQVPPEPVEAEQNWVRALLAEQTGDLERALVLAEEARHANHCLLCGTTDLARMQGAAAGNPAAAIAAWEDRAGLVDYGPPVSEVAGATRLTVQLWSQPLVYEQLCSLHAEHGDDARAVEYCGLFVEMWADADPELRPRVEAARRSLESAALVTG